MWSTIYIVDERGIQGTAGLILINCNRDISIYMTVFFQYCKYTTARPLADSFYKRPSYSFPFCLFELSMLSKDSASINNRIQNTLNVWV